MYNAYTLLGVTEEVKNAVAGFLQKNPQPSVYDVADFFRLMSEGSWAASSRLLLAAGVSPAIVKGGMEEATQARMAWIKGGLTVASAAASAFHGTRRNNSIFWGVCWFLAGLAFPVFTPVVAVAQGYAKRKA